jgi:hypothetical protein
MLSKSGGTGVGYARRMRPGTLIVVMFGLFAVAAGCGRGHYATFSYAQADGGCPGGPTPGLVNGAQANGGGCDADADCMIVCCACMNKDGRGFAAHACFDGKCNSDEACQLPASAKLCP